MKFIHLTDTHFVPKGKTLYGRDPRDALKAAIADINAHHGDAELAVITGDLTHWGEAEALEYLAESLSALELPVQLLIGNHDDRAVFVEMFPAQARDENGFVQSFLDVTAGRFLFLDTVQDGSHAGHYCEARRAWLSRTLEQSADCQDLFLFMHHPPFATGLPAMDRIGLQEPEAFRRLVEPHRTRIRHLFFGHVHRPIAGSWLGIPVSTLRSMNHQVWFDMKSETLWGSFEPPAYCVVLVDDDRVVVHTHDYLDPSRKFNVHDSPWDDWARKRPRP